MELTHRKLPLQALIQLLQLAAVAPGAISDTQLPANVTDYLTKPSESQCKICRPLMRRQLSLLRQAYNQRIK
jgi:hypothetical protein